MKGVQKPEIQQQWEHYVQMGFHLQYDGNEVVDLYFKEKKLGISFPQSGASLEEIVRECHETTDQMNTAFLSVSQPPSVSRQAQGVILGLPECQVPNDPQQLPTDANRN